MKIEWVVAKYMEDLRKRETQNIGVILRVGDQVLSRFVAEREDGEIDGRRARRFKSVDTYKAWVDYWRYRMRRAPEQGLLAALEFQSPSNFIVEYGGERIWSADMPDPLEFLDELYEMLVEESASTRLPSARDKGDALIRELPMADQIESDYVLPHDGPGRLEFDYRYINGAEHLMRVVSLGRPGKSGWDAVQAAVWVFEKSFEVLGELVNPIALVASTRRNPEITELYDFLQAQVKVVDLGDQRKARRQLREYLNAAA